MTGGIVYEANKSVRAAARRARAPPSTHSRHSHPRHTRAPPYCRRRAATPAALFNSLRRAAPTPPLGWSYAPRHGEGGGRGRRCRAARVARRQVNPTSRSIAVAMRSVVAGLELYITQSHQRITTSPKTHKGGGFGGSPCYIMVYIQPIYRNSQQRKTTRQWSYNTSALSMVNHPHTRSERNRGRYPRSLSHVRA